MAGSGGPVTGIIDVPEWDDPEFVVAPLPDQEWPAGAGQMTENFLDMGHLPFLHAKTFGDPDAIEVPPYTVERDGWTFVCDLRHSAKVLSDSHGVGEGSEYQIDERRSTWWYAAPYALRLRLEYADGVVLTILFFHQPVDAVRPSSTPSTCATTSPTAAPPWRTRWRSSSPSAPRTRRCWPSCRDTATPLDLQAEVHTRADRNTVEMRRVLKDLVDHRAGASA